MDVLQAELIHIVSEFISLRFQIPTIDESSDQELHAIFAIDKSGSMNGYPIEDARGAASSLVSKFRKMDIPVTIYTFSHVFEEMSSITSGYDEMTRKIEQLKGSGGTEFKNVIIAMKEHILKENMKNIFCVWLSDGDDDDGLAFLTPLMEGFKADMEAAKVSIATHCIGFDEYHNADLLTRLSNSGTRPGTFQYVPDGGRIPVAVNNVYNLAFELSIWGRVYAEGQAYQILVQENLSTGKPEGMIYMSENDLGECTVELHQGSRVKTFQIETIRSDIFDLKETINLLLTFLSTKVLKTLEAGASGSRQRLREMDNLIDEAERRLNDLYTQAQFFSPLWMMQITPFYNAGVELIGKFREFAEGDGEDLENLDVANLSAVANAILLKKNLEVKIIKEHKDAYFEFQLSEADINRGKGILSPKDLQKKHNEISHLKCKISNTSIFDLISKGDCLCCTFCVQRPQNLSSDPYGITVTGVSTDLISFDSFIESDLFTTKAGQIIQGRVGYRHGEMPPPASEVCERLSDYSINAFMPLYLCEEHWNTSKHRMRSALGFTTQVDIFGYSPEQLAIIPYMVLIKARENSDLPSEIIGFIKEVCLQIYLDNRENYFEVLSKLLLQYISDPSSRMPESIPNSKVFLCQISIAMEAGDLIEYKDIFRLIVQEETRRELSKNAKKFSDLCKELLEISTESQLKALGQSLNKPNASYAELYSSFARDLKEKGNTMEIDKFNFSGRIAALSPLAAELWGKVNNFLHANHLKSELSYVGIDINSLEDIGIITNEQKLAFLIECFGHTDELRKVSIEKGEIANVFSPEDSIAFIQKTYSDTVNRELAANKSKILHELQLKEGEERAETFKNTLNLEEAAGCLYGICQGHHTFNLFVDALKHENVPLVLEKAKMLTHGHYQGVKLVMDKSSGDNYALWTPNKKTFHKIWKNNMGSGTMEQWKEVFPSKTEHIENQYRRIEGEFVPYSKPKKNVVDPRHWEMKNKEVKAPRPKAAGNKRKNLVKKRKIDNKKKKRAPGQRVHERVEYAVAPPQNKGLLGRCRPF